MQCFEFLLLLTCVGNQVAHETEMSNKPLQQKIFFCVTNNRLVTVKGKSND